MKDLNEITGAIVDCAYHLHTTLGPGLFESVYLVLMDDLLTKRGHDVRRQVPIDIVYEGVHIPHAFKADLIVDNRVVVEIKSREKIGLLEEKQLFTYTKLLDFRVGLLINFGAPLIKDGIKRIANRLVEADTPER